MVDLETYRATSGEGHFIERIKAPVFLEAVLAIEINVRAPTQFRIESQSNKSFWGCLNYFVSFLKIIHAKFLDDLLAVVNGQFPLILLFLAFAFPMFV